ncbi:MAG: aminotransferase class V-fold PLP-dependent enzyme [Candidatus Heimdallarchaeota archaeon]|nr:aminotransferase class V-fold PLP-dependent enzyme [Candidatus Heimdallarchaeota archaeon]
MDYRNAFNDFGDIVFLNASHKGPLPKVSQKAIQQAIELQSEPWNLIDHMWFDIPDMSRDLIAKIIGAEADEIAITTSTSYGINIIAQGIDWQQGDTILMIRGNFPSNVYPWMRLESKGVVIDFIEWTAPGDLVTQEQLENKIIPGVKVVAIDYPHWTNGYLMDLKSLKVKCEEVGAWLVLDCTQSIGVIPIDINETPVDAIIASGYKYMLSPYGTGFMYVAKSFQREISVTMPTWMGMSNSKDFGKLNDYEFNPVQSAARYDVGGHSSFLNIMGMNASLEFLLGVGIDKIYAHVLNLLDQLISGLDTTKYTIISDLSPNRRSAMLRFVPKDLSQIQSTLERLKNNKIYVSFRDNGFRVTLHVYNNEVDIRKFLEIL